MGIDCQIYGGVSFGSEPYLVTLGKQVKVTAGCSFVTHDGGVHVLRNLGVLPNGDYFGRIVVGDNVFFGLGCVVLPNVTIGSNVVVGARAVVTKDIPDNSVAAGVPARVVATLEEYGERKRRVSDPIKNLSAAEKRIYLVKKYHLYERRGK